MSYASYIAKSRIFHRFVGWFLRDFFQKVENHSMFDCKLLSSQVTHLNVLILSEKALSWQFEKVQNHFCRYSVSWAIRDQSRAIFWKIVKIWFFRKITHFWSQIARLSDYPQKLSCTFWNLLFRKRSICSKFIENLKSTKMEKWEIDLIF